MLPIIKNHERDYVRLPSQIPDHLKCGEVYTWLCNGELYAVECSLCEDKPLCPLSEFPQHMEVWHTDWEEHKENDSVTNEQQDHLFDDDDEDNEENSLLSFHTEDSGLYEQDHMDNVDVLEPFEQVLIEQDEMIINSIQNNEDVVVDTDNDVEICAIDNKTAQLQKAELKGEIVLEKVEQHKQKIINKTITEKYNNKCKQKYENKLNEINGMEHTGENKMETKGNHKQNKGNEENITNLFATKNLKRNCSTTHKRGYLKRQNYKSLRNIKDFKKIKQKFLKHKNLLTIKSIASDLKGNIRNSRAKIYISKENYNISHKFSDVEQKFEEKEKLLSEVSTFSNVLEQSSAVTNTQKFKNFLDNIKNASEIEDYSPDSKNIIQKLRDSSDLQETLLENESLTAELRHTSTAEKHSLQHKLKDSVQLRQSPLHEQCLTKVSCEQKIKNSSEQDENSSDNLKDIEEMLQQCLRDPNDLEEDVLDIQKPRALELYLADSKTYTPDRDLNDINKNFQNLENITENSQISRDSEEFLHKKQSFMVEFSNPAHLEASSPHLESISQSRRSNSRDLEECTLENVYLTNEIIDSSDGKQSFAGHKDLINEVGNSSGDKVNTLEFHVRELGENSLKYEIFAQEISNSNDIEENSLENQDLIQELTISNDFAETLLDQENTVSEILETTTSSVKMIQNLQSSNAKQSSKTSDNIIRKQNNVEEKGNISVYDEEVYKEDTEDTSQIGRRRKTITQSFKDYKEIYIIKPEECKRASKIQDEIMLTQEGETMLNRNFPNNAETSFQDDLEKSRMGEKKLGDHLKANKTSKASLRSTKRNRNPKDSLVSINGKRRSRYLRTNARMEKQFEFSRKENNIKRKSKKAKQSKNLFIKNQPHSTVFEEKLDPVSQLNNRTNKALAKISILSMKLRSNSQKTCEKLNNKPSDNTQVSELNQVFENSSQVSDNKSCAAQVTKHSSIKKIKQTRVTEFFKNLNINTTNEYTDVSLSNNFSSSFKSNCPVLTLSPQMDKTEESKSENCSLASSLLSPKTEEEHFELYEPKEKLTKHHISHLIELYKKHPRLWDQSHSEFCEPHLCRKSWQEITNLWNDYCKRNFTIAEVRIRICTLCQRYLQERERLVLEGELDEFAKFPYYEQMRFLEHQKSLQKRKDLYDQQNEKIVEIYEHFPLLWHVKFYKLRQAKERASAFESISKALKLNGIHLSAMGVQKRIRSLKKCYRLEKIRYLHAQVEQTAFESGFKHYEKMQFLDKHIDPFVCRICGKILENLAGFREHLEKENHGSILQEDSESDSEKAEAEGEKEELQYNTNAVALENEKNTPKFSTENDKPIIQEVLIFPPNRSQATVLINFPAEDQLIEEIIENVSNTENFASPSLDNSISCKEICVNSPSIKETVPTVPLSFECSNNNLNIQDESAECTSYEDLLVTKENQKNLESEPLLVKVQCADFSLDLKLGAQPEVLDDSDNELQAALDTCSTPLADHEIHKMIELYRKYPQLWNPNHLDYNSRNLRRQAWFTLTSEFCVAVGKQFSWRTLHRKLTDYAKYYKKLMMEQENYKEITTKWTFYENFKFLDDVIAVHDELQRSVHHRDNNFKIIAIYETLPQLWNIKHPDFNKRCLKQRNIELMCNRLQEDNNFQITSKRLKNRLIELRAQYRSTKKQRLKCEKNQQKFFADFEFYEALKFLDDHIDPFICKPCKMEFKKLTDHNYHQKRQHDRKHMLTNTPLSQLPPSETGQDSLMENICHICGIKFTTRSNLMHHVKRHEGIKNYACTMCPKKFFASHSLKIHIRSHTKECPYTCEKCGLSFVSASKLNQHVKRHSNKRDYDCNYCPKAFYTAFERDRHERRHLNIRDKACPICGKTFVAGSSYYAHMMLHSDTKRFKCDKCDMKFAQYSGLYKHKKRHHTGIEECK